MTETSQFAVSARNRLPSVRSKMLSQTHVGFDPQAFSRSESTTATVPNRSASQRDARPVDPSP